MQKQTMRIRFADISQMLWVADVADPRPGARLWEAQHVQSMRMPINRIGMKQTRRRTPDNSSRATDAEQIPAF